MMWAMSSAAGTGSAGLAVDDGIVDVDDRRRVPVEPVGQLRGGDDGDRRGVGEHELHAGRRHRGVDRQICRPCLEDRQDRHDRLGRTRKQQRHRLTRAGPAAGQQMRQPVGGFVQFAIRQGPARTGQRHGFRGPRYLRGEGSRNRRAGGRPRQRRSVAPLVQPGALLGIQHIHRRQPPARLCGHGHQHALQPIDQRLDAVRIEDVGVVFDANRQFVTGLGLQRQRVVGGFPGCDIGDGQVVVANQCAAVDRVVLEGEESVEELVLTRDPMDLAERQVLVLKGVVVRALQLIE
jgi:hypothetical protein